MVMILIEMKQDELFLCIDMIKDKKNILILSEMETKKQFKDLANVMSCFDKQEMQNRLEELIVLGMITRIVNVNRKPMKIEYVLTNRGAMLLKCIRKMRQIGSDIKKEFHIENTKK